ncbi:MAG: hypothetical protein K1X56_14585, partial [Flavobacteriales bacterium]|nr:hypothetical protein [Flavobacteriales bacterium]
MRRLILSAILIFFLCYLAMGQTQSPLKRYWEFLQHDSIQQNKFLMPAAHFMMSENGAVTAAGRGTYLSLGINAARLFSKKFELGFHIEMKVWKGLWPVNYSSDFVNGFNQNYANTLGDAKDSARAEVLYKAINGSESYSFRGTFYGSYA